MKTKATRKGDSNITCIETFRQVGDYELGNLLAREPSCFNAIVSFRKYKITIELVDEPNEVLAKRLQKLWDECDNYHNWTPLKSAAKSIGYEFINRPGERGGRK